MEYYATKKTPETETQFLLNRVFKYFGLIKQRGNFRFQIKIYKEVTKTLMETETGNKIFLFNLLQLARLWLKEKCS